MADLAQLEESIVALSLLEAAELVKKLESDGVGRGVSIYITSRP